jgi:hypothetical protein
MNGGSNGHDEIDVLEDVIVAQLSEKTLSAKALGATPKQIGHELRMFSRAARVLSSDHPRLIDKHPKEWVGVYNGKVCAVDKTFNGLLRQLKRGGLSPSDVIIRYIDASGRKLIL